MFPVRCFSCGSVVGKKEKSYQQLLENGTSPKDALDSLNISRYCCRRMFLCHYDVVDKLNLFPQPDQSKKETKKSNTE
jgi:DNA-directed RNA polymerase subunit N (RpoN/RPB10)